MADDAVSSSFQSSRRREAYTRKCKCVHAQCDGRRNERVCSEKDFGTTCPPGARRRSPVER